MTDSKQCVEIAKALGAWTLDDGGMGCPRLYLATETGIEGAKAHGFGLVIRQEGAKLRISSLTPVRVPSGWYYAPPHGWPAISVSASRQPVAIAAEIARRLLPAYIVAWNEAIRQLNLDRKHTLTTQCYAQMLAGILGTKPYGQELDKINFHSMSNVYGDVHVCGNGATFKVNFADKDKAIRLAQYLRTWMDEKEKSDERAS